MCIRDSAYIENPKNKNIYININGELHHRNDAKISVFDSGFLLGDGVWEGIRLHNGRLVFIDEHLDRLFDSLIVTKGVKQADLVVGDKNAVMVAARVLAYGPEYPATVFHEGVEHEVSFDLSKVEYSCYI